MQLSNKKPHNPIENGLNTLTDAYRRGDMNDQREREALLDSIGVRKQKLQPQ